MRFTSGFSYLTRRRPRRAKTPGGHAVARDGYGPNWRAQRKAALERDEYRCQRCGRQAPQDEWWRVVAVHHKRKIRLFYDEKAGGIDYRQANELNNLETLCHECHKVADGHKAMEGFKPLGGA